MRTVITTVLACFVAMSANAEDKCSSDDEICKTIEQIQEDLMERSEEYKLAVEDLKAYQENLRK